MNKKIIILLIIAIVWGAGYFWASSYSNIPEGSPAKKAVYALNEAGCVMCHSKDAKPPFYGYIPLVGSLIKNDMALGLRNFDIAPTMNAIEQGLPANESALAKIEYVVDENTMPPLRFKLVHWFSNINSQERAAIADWISIERKQLNAKSGIAEEFANEPVWPIPEALNVDKRKAELGEILYHHTALSGDNTVSCATCHPLEGAGVDALQTSTGIREQKGDINAPTVYNAAFNFKQFWDGRANSLEEQAGGPPMNPVEMDGGSWSAVAERLSKDSDFEKEFKKVYPDGFNEKNITDAIAAFERTLITPNSPFDRYLKGDKNAITKEQIRGYELFKQCNCTLCHSGQNFGGQSFEYMGLARDYFNDRGDVGKINDTGLAANTKDERDFRKFKTPTLRNVALTAPYFHDGSSKTLKHAVEVMAKYQRDKELDDDEISAIVKFLESLTGELNGKPLQKK